jgi:spermidine synthase
MNSNGPKTLEVLSRPRFSSLHLTITFSLFFTSGFTTLVYEVLWMKELGLLFGNTTQATATTLAAFFIGLAAGAYFWGRRAVLVKNSLRTYALLEAGVAVSALLYFLLLDAYHTIYSPMFQSLGHSYALFVTLKFILALGVLFPPAFFMGGTLPIMSQHLVQSRDTLGSRVSALYAINIIGAASGAFTTGFYLPPLLGFMNSYLLAITITCAVALVAWIYGRKVLPPSSITQNPSNTVKVSLPNPQPLYKREILLLTFLSGFVTLSLEVLWTHMFAQVLQNSVYTFTTILVTFLICLALGAGVASILARRSTNLLMVLIILLSLSAILVSISPFVFYWVTDGLAYLGAYKGFAAYLLRLFWSAAVVMLLPGIFLGSIFPFLIKMSESFTMGTGRTVGNLSAVNMIGAITGSLSAGFLLLDFLGLWASIRLMAALYFAMVLLVAESLTIRRYAYRAAVVIGFFLLVSLLDTSRLPRVRFDPIKKQENLLEVWETSGGTVTVIRQPTNLQIKINNHYTLGGTEMLVLEERQAHIPLLLHPQPHSVFFLGMGTGITAGAALDHPVDRVVVCELVQEVIEASQKYFKPYLHGLFEDRRATIIAEDGRNYLFGTSERFDVIIADLFFPWKAGTGNLYTREHFTAVHARLQQGGLFMQWIPLYQMSREEFSIIARTMLDIFPLVTLWRGDFLPDEPIVGLVGHRDNVALDLQGLIRRLEQAKSAELINSSLQDFKYPTDSIIKEVDIKPFLFHYCGNFTAAHKLLDGYPLNTDDRPLIEYRSPITDWRQKAKETSWFTMSELINFFDELFLTVPPERDPYLKKLTGQQTMYIRAGLSLYRAQVLKKADDEKGAREALNYFNHLITPSDSQRAVLNANNYLEQLRQELEPLIKKYEQRIRALKERLKEEEAVIEGGH